MLGQSVVSRDPLINMSPNEPNRLPDLMTPSEVIEVVIRAAEKATILPRLKWDSETGFHKLIDADLFIQALKDELI